jgi:hypothetical protein
MNDKPWKIPRTLAAAAVAVGVAGGSYGIASAAPSTAAPWGRQRSDETLLPGGPGGGPGAPPTATGHTA